MTTKTVYMHLRTHNIDPHSVPLVCWKILNKKITYENQRQIIEAFEIRRYTDRVMNGGVSRILNISINYNLPRVVDLTFVVKYVLH